MTAVKWTLAWPRGSCQREPLSLPINPACTTSSRRPCCQPAQLKQPRANTWAAFRRTRVQRRDKPQATTHESWPVKSAKTSSLLSTRAIRRQRSSQAVHTGWSRRRPCSISLSADNVSECPVSPRPIYSSRIREKSDQTRTQLRHITTLFSA